MLTKITHITLFVNDQDTALNFYQKLGFKVHTDAMFGEMRWLTLHLPTQIDMELVLLKAESEHEKALVGKQAGDKPVFNFETSDCLGDYERLSVAGVNFLAKPETQPWGTSAAFTDADGNVLYMCQSVVN
jgi:catechol 2,3-dioxygenase-like lactoylglutathione lyase family enzyme